MKLVDKSLTDLQKRFARIHVEAHYGNQHLSNTECAIKAGYSPDSAYQRAYELLNPRISPHVVNYIGKLKEDIRIKNNSVYRTSSFIRKRIIYTKCFSY